MKITQRRCVEYQKMKCEWGSKNDTANFGVTLQKWQWRTGLVNTWNPICLCDVWWFIRSPSGNVRKHLGTDINNSRPIST